MFKAAGEAPYLQSRPSCSPSGSIWSTPCPGTISSMMPSWHYWMWAQAAAYWRRSTVWFARAGLPHIDLLTFVSICQIELFDSILAIL
jgi:hypothetical protein